MPVKFTDYRVVKGEKQRTYQLKITFNGQKIIATTITNYYELKHKKKVNDSLIMELLKRLNNKRLRPTKYPKRKAYKWETIYQNQSYRLVFWFKDRTTNHLWIRNCHPQD